MLTEDANSITKEEDMEIKEIDSSNIFKIYKDRLIDFSSKNNLLVCKAGSSTFDINKLPYCNLSIKELLESPEKSYRLNMREYVNSCNDSISDNLNEANNEEIPYVADRQKEFTQILKKIVSIQRKSKSILKDTGKDTLYIGGIFITQKLRPNLAAQAPLVLIPVELSTTKTSFTITKSDRSILVNRTLVLALLKFTNVDIQFDSYEIDDDVDGFTLQYVLDKLKEVVEDLDFNTEPEGVPKYNKDKVSEVFKVNNYCLMSNFNVSDAIYDDYTELEGTTINSQYNLMRLLDDNAEATESTEQYSREYNQESYENRGINTVSMLDTSQELAVYMTTKCSNLVIFGPPGTGKSEVILNIIVDALTKGKKLLIVSEKKTALDVIYNRLGTMNNLALPLTETRGTLKSFKEMICTKFSFRQSGIALKAGEVNNKSLDEILTKLIDIHDKLADVTYRGMPVGYWYNLGATSLVDSSSEVYFLLCDLDAFKKLIELDYEPVTNVLGKSDDAELQSKYTQFKTLMQDYSMDMFNNIITKEELNRLRLKITAVRDKIKDYNECYEYMVEKFNYLDTDAFKIVPDSLNTLTDIVIEHEFIEGKLELDLLSNCANLGYSSAEVACKQEIQNKLGYDYNNKSSTDGLSTLIEQRFSDSDFTSVKDTINKVVSDYIEITHAELCNSIRELSKWSLKNLFNKAEKEQKLSSLKLELENLRHGYTKECEEKTIVLKRNKVFLDEYISLCKRKVNTIQTSIDTRTAELSKVVLAHNERLKDIRQEVEYINKVSPIRIDIASSKLEVYLDDLLNFLDSYNSSIVLARYFSSLDKDLINLLECAYQLYITQDMTFGESLEFIRSAYIYKIVNEVEALYASDIANNSNYDILIKEFDEVQCTGFNGTIKQVFDRCLEVEKAFVDSNSMAYVTLNRELGKARSKLSSRTFIRTYVDSLMASFPVWLATPDLVSKLIPLKNNLFDMVVFDEASQMYVERGIPSIVRGEKVVIVGDDKQLKPSSTFMSRLDDYDELDDTDDSTALSERSLLDLAKLKFNSVSLLFHYRSKYAELINFSNYAFYTGRLKLAPNVSREGTATAIERIKVDGIWENNSNEEEAKQVCKLVKDILLARKDNETIGIITFNSTQVTKIESKLDDLCMEDEEIYDLYNNECSRIEDGEDKSLFIKNIENVQGDERDVIIFSIGYAKNTEGNVRNNFGSLSQSGGENRLNVAVSRAKKRIIVVTSIEPEELNVSTCKNMGAILLQKYLQYIKAIANNSKVGIETVLQSLCPSINRGIEQKFDSPFEEQVYTALVNKGYSVDTQVGAYGFFIDMAVYDEQNGKYICGIECDGSTYHSSKYARERDINRHRFLESRGWTLLRIWSTDWWRDQNDTLENIERLRGNEISSTTIETEVKLITQDGLEPKTTSFEVYTVKNLVEGYIDATAFKPSKLIYNTQEIKVQSWSDVLVSVLNILCTLDVCKFDIDNIDGSLSPTEGWLCSSNANKTGDMIRSVRINNGLWLGTHGSTKRSLYKLKKIYSSFPYIIGSIEIYIN